MNSNLGSVRQTVGALRIGLASHAMRPRHLLLIMAGFAISGLTLILLLSIPAGLEDLGAATGRDDIALVLASSALDEAGSTIAPELASLVGALPNIVADSTGLPQIAPQFVTNTRMRRPDGAFATVQMRGITPATWMLLNNSVYHTSGTSFRRGTAEAMAGMGAARSFIALEPEAHFKVRNSVWKISGQFAGGGVWESELWADIAPLQSAFNAPGRLSVLWVRLDSSQAFDKFRTALGADKRLRELRTERQRDYYARPLRFIAHFAHIVAFGIGAALGVGALLAIVNALTLSVVARRRELATMRALGFGAASLAAALIVEILLIGLVSTILTTAFAWVALDGLQIGSSTTTQAIRFSLSVSPTVMAWTLAYTLTLGVASALWPAHKAVRMPLLTTLAGE